MSHALQTHQTSIKRRLICYSLLRAAREAESPSTKAYEDIVQLIQNDHLDTVKTLIDSPKIASQLCAEIISECQDLLLFLAAVQKIGEISSRSLDSIISKGENLSCRLLAAVLNDQGIDAQFVNLSYAIDIQVLAGGLDQEFYAKLGRIFADEVRKCGDKVPVLTGYFGVIPGGLLKQIGRGYTDLCAALVSVGLQASELQVWKEVDGIFTADPRKVPTARLLPEISPAEAAELTFYGSEVIHPFTMEQVIRARIPIRIKNVRNPRGSGTVIAPDAVGSSPSSPGYGTKLFRNRSSSLLSQRQRPKRPTAVTIKHNILVLNVHSNKRSLSHGFFAKIFSTLDKWRLSVDLISTSEVHVSMALHSESALVSGGGEDGKKIVDKDLHGAILELEQFGSVDWIDGMAILSLVGKQMKHMVGVAGRMFSTLGENNVNIEMISQGLLTIVTAGSWSSADFSYRSERN